MPSNEVFKTDDTGAFGNQFITINLNNPQEYPISKAIFVCGCLKKTYVNPVFPWVINYNSEESAQFRAANVCYLVVYDSQGRQKTCKGTLTFNAKNGVICNG